jgi:hypothetical protein
VKSWSKVSRKLYDPRTRRGRDHASAPEVHGALGSSGQYRRDRRLPRGTQGLGRWPTIRTGTSIPTLAVLATVPSGSAHPRIVTSTVHPLVLIGQTLTGRGRTLASRLGCRTPKATRVGGAPTLSKPQKRLETRYRCQVWSRLRLVQKLLTKVQQRGFRKISPRVKLRMLSRTSERVSRAGKQNRRRSMHSTLVLRRSG